MDLQQKALTAKQQPFGEAVVRLDLVRASRNLLAQLGTAQVLQQERGPNNATEFSEGLIEVVASAVSAQLSQEQRRRHDASFHRKHDLEQVLPVGLDQVSVAVPVALCAGGPVRQAACLKPAGSCCSATPRDAREPVAGGVSLSQLEARMLCRVQATYEGKARTWVRKQGDVSLLNDPVAQQLLHANSPAKLAYSWTDGTPRVVPIGIHWDGRQIVIGTPARAPKLAALKQNPKVALTIDTNDFPYHVLMVRGSVDDRAHGPYSGRIRADGAAHLGPAQTDG